MLRMQNNSQAVWRTTDEKMPDSGANPSTYYKTERGKRLRALHENLTHDWNLHSPDVRRILLTENKKQASKKPLFVPDDSFIEDELYKIMKGTSTMQKMARHEQVHKLQNAIHNRIMAHKFMDSNAVIYTTQIKAIRRLLHYLNKHLASLCKLVSLGSHKSDSFITESSESYRVELDPLMLAKLMDNFYQERKLSRTVDEKITSPNKFDDFPPRIPLQLGTKRQSLVQKMLVKSKLANDFPTFLKENEDDVYFLLGFPSRPSMKQLLGNFRNGHQTCLQREQQMYHLFNLCILSNTLLERAYTPKCLL